VLSGNLVRIIHPPCSNSQVAGARASFDFVGNAVAFYGTVSSGHSNMQVTLDNQTTTVKSRGTDGFGPRPSVRPLFQVLPFADAAFLRLFWYGTFVHVGSFKFLKDLL
jgi:hypothetical protein